MSQEGNEQAPIIELSIVMAGAVSAGSYTAGVMTRLFELLDTYYEYYDSKQENPPVEFRLRMVGGASAGGVNAAIAAVCQSRKLVNEGEEIPEYLATSKNPFYHTWVSGVNTGTLLAPRTGGNHPSANPKAISLSIFNAGVLDDIGEEILEQRFTGQQFQRKWYPPTTRHLFTLTNLPGVGYEITLGKNTHGMYNHRDWISFSKQKIAYAFSLDDNAEHWNNLRDAGLATSAFPIGLSARTVVIDDASVNHYDDPFLHHQYGSIPENRPTPTECHARISCVDGGVINNEPIELMNRYLIQDSNAAPENADRDVTLMTIMIDPFPNVLGKKQQKDCNGNWPETTELEETFGTDPTNLLKVGLGVVDALKNTARFKPNALSWADGFEYQHGDKMKKGFLFSINPSRKKRSGAVPNHTHLASGLWGGFFGFFHESFRAHDFKLGYHNADRMLMMHFKLNEEQISESLANALKKWDSFENSDTKAAKARTEPGLYIFPDGLGETKLWRHIRQPDWPIKHAYEKAKLVWYPRREDQFERNKRRAKQYPILTDLQATERQLIKRIKWFRSELLKQSTDSSFKRFFAPFLGRILSSAIGLDGKIKQAYKCALDRMYDDY
ncbi:MAG: patatin-like phospholipase family protein [Pseudomonadales bacterium]|nr:patatin-like phospholipase family protein [Pseudomonadales bacterium]